MKKQQGFSLLELFITLSIGLVLLSGVLAVFVGMRTTSDETSRYGMMQETGRFAVSVLTDDLMRQGFFGDLLVPPSTSNLVTIPGDPTGECTGDGLNNGSFPGATGNYRTLWSSTATAISNMGCINNARVGSDILQLKRTITSPITSAERIASKYYLVSNFVQGTIVTGLGVLPTINDSQIYEYQHHTYYVADETQGSTTIPTLKSISLATTMNKQPMVDGVEKIRFMFGVDTDQDGFVNAFLSADEMNESGSNTGRLWDSGASSIVAVKIYVLIRDLDEDTSYTNSIVYNMGNDSDDSGKFTAPGDHFRRMLFSSTVSLFNGDVKIWN